MLSVHKIVVEGMLEGAEVVCDTHHVDLGRSYVCNATYPLTQARVDTHTLVSI